MIKAKPVDSVCVVDADGRIANLKSNMARGLPVSTEMPKRDDPLAIVGSGPSVSTSLAELREWPGAIWAINGAYDYLLSQDIVPHGFVAIDPLPGLVEYVQNPHPETTFYIASTCDPSVLDALDGHNVILWHAASEDTFELPGGSKPIFGGTTVVTRAPFLAIMQGFRSITMFGVDSSYEETGPYCYRWGTYKEDINNPIMRIMINGEGPFYSELGLVKQIPQLFDMLKIFNQKQNMLTIRPAGLMGAYMRAPVLDDSQVEVVNEADAA